MNRALLSFVLCCTVVVAGCDRLLAPIIDDDAPFTIVAPSQARQGDAVWFSVVHESLDTLRAKDGLTWSVVSSAGAVDADGWFVGYDTDAPVEVRAAFEGDTASVEITIEPRGLGGSFTLAGAGRVGGRQTSDLWVHGTAAYTGTWGGSGDRLLAWDVSDPSNPTITDSVVVDAGTVNDVKVSADGRLGILTHEHSRDGLNGITLLDLSAPLHPAVITRYTDGLAEGVHNVWIEGDYAYVVEDWGGGLHILDISDPAAPVEVHQYHAGVSFLHDVYVRDGLAFLSHWDAGLIILDVGHGIRGGTPESPVEVSRIHTASGQTHNAWYWPEGGYVFVGEEDFTVAGRMHVVDVSDLEHPVEVATFQVSGTTPHNFWLDEANAVLYAAWYEKGLRAIDVSGRLVGALDRQGREYAHIIPSTSTAAAAAPACHDDCGIGDAAGSMVWAPQLHDGLVFASDMNHGLWVYSFEPHGTP